METKQGAAFHQHSSPEQLVDALNGVFGKQQPAVRAVHAKGINLKGVFRPGNAARNVSKAPHFQTANISINVRFSDFTGFPAIADNDPLASPRGMAIKFHLPDGSDTDIVAHSFNGFPVATADEFRELMIAMASSGPGVPKPTPLDSFLTAHPAAKTFLESQIPPPASYATVSYFGVNTFKFSNAEGKITFGRYQIRPAQGEKSLPFAEAKSAQPDYLRNEIKGRISHGSVSFKLLLQVAEKGDDLDDPSIAWPDNRTQVELGTVEITQAVSDNAAAERELLFLPGALPAGIEAQDPMIRARQDAYPVSYERRREPRQAAA
ncbi:MAG TPA: catalase family peroxidase [Terriglobales bacterium]|nr:catalase family peroxidase [Terriglobales bacterium]